MSRGGAESARQAGLSEPAPTGRGRVRRWVLVAGLVGLAIAAAIVLYVGWDQIGAEDNRCPDAWGTEAQGTHDKSRKAAGRQCRA